MAAWAYDDWITYDDGSAKLTRLRLHVQEVSARLSQPASYSTDGLSVARDSGALTAYYDRLREDLAALESSFGNSGRAIVTRGLGIQ
jgi:hypothetical protein